MATNNSNEQIRNISIQDRQAQNTAADWARQLRFSNDVNMSTVGVDTDRVTPDLLMATSKKLLGISRGQQQGDAKDSLRYQKVYGPVEYFAQHVQRDGGSVARSLLWKATNKGNLDFIGSGSLQPHVSSVFNESNLTRFVDNSTPLDGVDNSMLLTRLGQGGLNSQDSAPIQMRLVQPSYYGYVGGIRTAQKCYSADTLIFTKQGWKNITQLTMHDQLACLIDNRVEWHTPLLLQSYDHDGMMYGFQNQFIDFLVTPNHRMYVSKDSDIQSFQIKPIDQVYGTKCRVVCGTGKESVVDETQKYFYLPRANSNNMKLTKYIQKVDIVDFAAFMGWYLSQGCCEKRRNWPADKGWKYKVKIAQSPKDHPENYQQIRQLIQRLAFGAHPKTVNEKKTGLDLVINRKQLFEYCNQFGKSEDKFIPDWIFTAPTKARWAFVDAMVKGDGSQQRHLNTISQKLANGFARLLFQLGQSVNVTKELQHWEYKRRVVNPETNFIYTVVWHKQMQQKLRNAPGNKKASGRCFYTEYYKGKVYCPTVPGGLVYVRRPQASKGFWCGNSPGITAYLDKNVMKGTDGRLYQKFYNPRTGKEQLVDSQKAAASVVTTNQYMNTKDKYVYALGGDKGVRIVPRESVDYILPRADQAESMAGNAVPMMSGVKAMRLLMGCLHPQTPVPFIDEQGFTDLVPAKRLGSYGDTYLYGCDQKGYQKLYKLQGVYSRFPDFNRQFKRVITASGRVLVTSPDHKWYVYQGGKYKKITADKLQQGMLIPRSTFFKLPSRLTTIFGVTITKEICVLVGRLLKSYEETPKTRRFTYVVNETVNQEVDIIQALKQLNIIGSNFYQRDDIHYVSITDVRLIDWIETEMKSKQAERKIPKAILSLPKGMTSYVLDSYCKQRENVGEDIFGDIWLLDIPSPIMRDGLSLMLGKIYTDTYYRDSYKNGKQYRALKLIESENQGTVYLQPIKKILDEPAPAFMVDLDCGDNVYAVGNGIITHNSKYALQAVPLQNPEAPLVRSLDQASGKDMDTLMGKFVGAQFAPKPGVVQAVRKDRIDMLYDDGTKGSVGLYDNFPANAKGWLSNYPMVKAGQRVGEGQLLAKSNYTDDKGVAAMGRNLRIGYMSYHGGTFEDACTISESAAKKMGYTTMYKTGMDTDKSIRSSKTLYNAWKPGEYTKEQMQKLDDKGVVKVGQTLNQGDPVILGIRTNQPSPGTMGKRILTDVSQTWQHAHPGVVTDVVKTRDGIKVYAKVSSPLALGDKISQRYGGKGTIAQIIPDDKMPRDSKGRPLDILFDPLGIVSRTNPSQMMQVGLGKVAQKLGHPIIVPQFMPKGQSRLKWVKDQMKKYNVPWKQDVYDPQTGKTISNVFTGNIYFLPLKHIADTKMSRRGTDQYSAQGIPGGSGQTGSKRLGSMQVAGLVGHDAFNFIQDAKLIRGQSNAQFWRSLRTGEIPVLPGQPLVHKKFFAHLQGSGMHIRKTPKGVSIMALTNKDVNDLAGSREVKSKDTYQQKTFREIDGGLFGKDIFGPEGNKWGYIQLDEPLPNPVMQEPLARLLRMSDQQFQNVVSGKQEVNGLKNSSDIQKALSKIDLKAQRVNALKELKEASASKRDAALKRYVAIARMQDNGTQPSDYMLNKIPVLPPEFRPITTQGNLTMVADSNYLYAQLLDARDDQRQAKNLTPELQNEARGNIYKRWKQLVGLYDPQSKKLKSKSVKGLLKWALGTSPKFSAFNRKVLGATVDTVGRAVGSPDPRLKLNQVGVPQQMAWGIFAPFVTRSLVQQGYTPVDAMKLVKQHNSRAKTVLLDQMSKRPVVVNRAPSLHKYNLYGAWPKLVTGHAMRWSPSICDNMSLDADGDQLNIHVPVSKKGIQDVINKMMPERMAILARKGKIAFMPQKAFMQGLYVATRMGDSSKGVKTFHSIQQAKQAYKNNQIDIDTPIVINRNK